MENIKFVIFLNNGFLSLFQKKMFFIFEVLNIEKLLKLFSVCWLVLGVWPR